MFASAGENTFLKKKRENEYELFTVCGRQDDPNRIGRVGSLGCDGKTKVAIAGSDGTSFKVAEMGVGQAVIPPKKEHLLIVYVRFHLFRYRRTWEPNEPTHLSSTATNALLGIVSPRASHSLRWFEEVGEAKASGLSMRGRADSTSSIQSVRTSSLPLTLSARAIAKAAGCVIIDSVGDLEVTI